VGRTPLLSRRQMTQRSLSQHANYLVHGVLLLSHNAQTGENVRFQDFRVLRSYLCLAVSHLYAGVLCRILPVSPSVGAKHFSTPSYCLCIVVNMYVSLRRSLSTPGGTVHILSLHLVVSHLSHVASLKRGQILIGRVMKYVISCVCISNYRKSHYW